MTFQSQYHYHFYPQADSSGYDGCLVSQCSPDVASDIVGVAFDGFPIYGPYSVGGVQVKTCGTQGADQT